MPYRALTPINHDNVAYAVGDLLDGVLTDEQVAHLLSTGSIIASERRDTDPPLRRGRGRPRKPVLAVDPDPDPEGPAPDEADDRTD